MSGGEWTPGPWRTADPARGESPCFIRDSRNHIIAEAFLFNSARKEKYPQAANARLIAAAPALAEACEAALPKLNAIGLPGGAHHNQAKAVSDILRAALAAAKGGAS